MSRYENEITSRGKRHMRGGSVFSDDGSLACAIAACEGRAVVYMAVPTLVDEWEQVDCEKCLALKKEVQGE